MEDLILIYLIAVILTLIIYYALIKAAVKAATLEANADMVKLLITQNRMLAKMLNEKGVTRQEIETVYSAEQVDFWNSLK